MLDLVIRGQKVVTPMGTGAFDVAIQGETIVAVASAGTYDAGSTRRLIDAGERIVMPGGIDPHVHCLWHVPNPDGTAGFSDPPETVSRAALRQRAVQEDTTAPKSQKAQLHSEPALRRATAA